VKKVLLVIPLPVVALVGLVSADEGYQDGSYKTGTCTIKDVLQGKCNLNGMASTVKPCSACSEKGYSSSCDPRSKGQYSDGCCDTYVITSWIHDRCNICGEACYLDGYCGKCGEKRSIYNHCSYCERGYSYSSRSSCPVCCKDIYYVEHCSKCGYPHNYNGYYDKCRVKTKFDKICHTSDDKSSYMRSDGYMVSMDIRRGSLNLDQEYIRVKRNPIVCQEFFLL
jgi:hypothetical protein